MLISGLNALNFIDKSHAELVHGHGLNLELLSKLFCLGTSVAETYVAYPWHEGCQLGLFRLKIMHVIRQSPSEFPLLVPRRINPSVHVVANFGEFVKINS